MPLGLEYRYTGSSVAFVWTSATITALSVGCLACGGGRTVCEELQAKSPDGVVLATEEERCATLLKFAESVQQRYKMDFKAWIETVIGQRVTMMHEAVLSLTRAGWTPASFARVPENVPCAPGMQVDAEFWNGSPITSLYSQQPQYLYVSLSLTVDTDVATIRAFQDFDCDGKIATQEVRGRFVQGMDPLGGGWSRISGTVPPIDE